MIKVLFVCTGNICRSPTAEGVFRHLVREAGLADRIAADSAGTHDYHVGEPPDPRACAAARARGYRIDDLRARKFSPRDFHQFDLVLAMDRGHHRFITRVMPVALAGRLRLFLDFAPELGVQDVPDPYYGSPEGFFEVLDLIEAGARGLLASLDAPGFA
jgi:protein-tyrosine phosphatase